MKSSSIVPAFLLLQCFNSALAEIDFTANEVDTAKTRGILDWIIEIIGGVTDPPELMPPENCPYCECGRTNELSRIVGGHETQVNEYPWMAMLLDNGRFYCGGSLINDRYVLTAAHCVQGAGIKRLSVRLLEHDTQSETESETITINVKRIVRHEKYSPLNTDNDIALLELEEVVNITDRLRPVCFPEVRKSFTGYDGIVTGWGAVSEGGSIATTLQEVTVLIISNEECRTKYNPDDITDNMMCAGYPEGGKDSCQGDSGGPMHVFNTTTELHSIVGIVSWGEGCARPDRPGVYTRVNRYLTWIKSNTANACYCSM